MRFAVVERVLLAASLAAGASGAPAAPAVEPQALQGAPDLVMVGVSIDDSAGNGDGWLQPGETVVLGIELFNAGNETATSVFGGLDDLGPSGLATILDKTATWPDMPPGGAPQLTDAPHFSVAVASQAACGARLSFRVEVDTQGGDLFLLDFAIRVGQRLDRDLLHDAVLRYEEPEATIWGDDGGDQTGEKVAWGDVNGDGYADAIVSIRLGDSVSDARNLAGEVALIYGKADQWSDVDLDSPPAGVARFWGAESSDQLGASVAAGDVNGDGFDDLILGATGGDSVANGRQDAGEFYLIYGQAAPWSDTDLAVPLPGRIVRFWGADTDDGLGKGTATGDLNGDGYDDLILGAWAADSLGNARPFAGEVYLVFGKPGLFNDTDLASPPFGISRVWGIDINDGLGQALAAGDVNGDGRDDLILGAYGAESTGNSRSVAGEVTLIYGQTGVWPDIDLATPPASVVHFWGAEPGDGTGFEVAGGGDVNGDGYEEILIGIGNGDSAGDSRIDAGEVVLVYGKADPWSDVDLLAPPPSGIARLWGADAGDVTDHVGFADIDGDGYDDVLLGAGSGDSVDNGRPEAGEVTVLYGGSVPMGDTDLASPPGRIERFRGADEGDFLGTGLAGGDLDGDGFDDLILTAPLADSAGSGTSCTSGIGDRCGAGEVSLWYGKPTDTYYARADVFAFIDASAGTALPLACDDCSTAVSIGFPFRYYGETFDTIHVSSNGVLSFGPIQDVLSSTPSCMPARRATAHLIAPFWDDLDLSIAGAVHALLEGTEPSRRLTIEWSDAPRYGDPAGGGITFEATLFESSGSILFQYQDLQFSGAGAFDNGGAAVAGVENRTGSHGIPYSCFDRDILADSTAVRFVPTTPIVEERAEHQHSLWSTSGAGNLWHLSSDTCEPDQHSGAASWFFGDSSCTYDTPVVIRGSVHVPTVRSFPADARLAYWFRRETEPDDSKDLSLVQLSNGGTGGPYTTVGQVTDRSRTWKYAGVTNLFGNAGDDVDLRFYFDTVDFQNNAYMGWMVDDVQLTGCNAVGAPAAAEAYAQSATYCAGSGGSVDAVGSFCGDSGEPSAYQWFEGGAPLGGATQVSYAIPAGQAAGTYDYTVEVGCPGGAMDTSAPATVSIVPPPAAVGPTLMVETSGGGDLGFKWTDVAGAEDYVVFEDSTPNGTFASETGSASTGATGLTVPMPPGTVFYFVAGRNTVCGAGPKH